MALKSINPVNEEIIKIYEEHNLKEIEGKINKCQQSWINYQEFSYDKKSIWMLNLSKKLLANKEKLATIMSLEMGKPLKDGIAEIEKCATVCEYYAINTAQFLKDEIIETEASKSFISYQPLGVILAIMPWNFPYWQVFRFLAPALMAGNAAILKHASNVTGCALAIEEMVNNAGFPKGIFHSIIINSKDLEPVIKNKNIKAVTLTGSTSAGKKVAQLAGSLIKKTVLELGGSDPYLILEDADLELAAETCVNSRLINNGQSCIAAKRFIVLKSIEKEFTALFLEKMKIKTFGDLSKGEYNLGPMARKDLRDELHQQVEKSIAKGAKCILGGEIPKIKGAFYPPTILTNVTKGMPAYEEELFGPVASIITVENEEEAINVANDTLFGLGAAIFSRDIEKAEKLAKYKIQAGCCFVNSLVKSDTRLPFGGINQSGYGRELGMIGIREFVNIKTVYIK
jgi:succinate-semialdehyde dehydrogenase/glutarate-semialdehyde dehydrogenase